MDEIFDFDTVRRNRARAVKSIAGHDFLFQKAAERLCDNLADIKRDFDNCLIVGWRGCDTVKAFLQDRKKARAVTLCDIAAPRGEDIILLDAEIPAVEGLYDAVIVLPYLHLVNDVPGALAALKAALKPDGVFLCALFGGQSLVELRESMMRAELAIKGGAARHIHPMIDHYQFAGLLQRAGFALPVADYDRVTVSYGELRTLYRDLKHAGEGIALSDRAKGITPRSFFTAVEKEYRINHADKDGRFIVTFDILHGIGWAPHDSQPQPARRGSGETSLTEIL